MSWLDVLLSVGRRFYHAKWRGRRYYNNYCSSAGAARQPLCRPMRPTGNSISQSFDFLAPPPSTILDHDDDDPFPCAPPHHVGNSRSGAVLVA